MPVGFQEKINANKGSHSTWIQNAIGNYPKCKKMPEISENTGTYQCASVHSTILSWHAILTSLYQAAPLLLFRLNELRRQRMQLEGGGSQVRTQLYSGLPQIPGRNRMHRPNLYLTGTDLSVLASVSNINKIQRSFQSKTLVYYLNTQIVFSAKIVHETCFKCSFLWICINGTCCTPYGLACRGRWGCPRALGSPWDLSRSFSFQISFMKHVSNVHFYQYKWYLLYSPLLSLTRLLRES